MAELRAKEGEFADVRNLAILELFYSTGMRLSELRGVNRADLDLVGQQVKVRGKGRKERIIPRGDRATLALRTYEHAHSAYPFGDVIHYTDKRVGASLDAIVQDLKTFLSGKGFADASSEALTPTVEDSFIARTEDAT